MTETEYMTESITEPVPEILERKLGELARLLERLGTVAIAFSGGVDSAFLLAFAQETIGSRAFAITVLSPFFLDKEARESDEFCRTRGIRQLFLSLPKEAVDGFSHNPPNRCYLCKQAIFSRILSLAKAEGASCVADGTNADDMGDYRPGLAALSELGIFSPLRDVGLTKAEIRLALKQRGLSIWNKPAFACLASRIPYGQEITAEKLKAVATVEEALHKLGFSQCRVRHHGDVARIEVPSEDRIRFFNTAFMDEVHEIALSAGFLYAALDLKGYRMGSLNAGINDATGKET